MRISLVLLAFLALTAVACSSSTSSSSTNLCANSGAAVTVDVTEYAFTPSSVTVIDGQSVCWANTGSMTHTVVEDVAGRFGGNLPPGQTLVHTFTGSENYGYHCGIHSTMTGTITGTCKPGVISC
jgi:plastocyanin